VNLQIKDKLCSSLSLSIIVTRQRELAANITHSIFIEVGSKFKFDGLSLTVIADVPDATPQSGIYHCPYLVLPPPYSRSGVL
jgi:hypothetical protein